VAAQPGGALGKLLRGPHSHAVKKRKRQKIKAEGKRVKGKTAEQKVFYSLSPFPLFPFSPSSYPLFTISLL
jgi:hypothetical protein